MMTRQEGAKMKGRILIAAGVTNIILAVYLAGADRSLWVVSIALWFGGTMVLVAEGADL